MNATITQDGDLGTQASQEIAVADMEQVAELIQKAKTAVEKVIYGQSLVVEESLITLLTH